MGIETAVFALAAASAVSTGVSLYKGAQADKQAKKAADLSRRQESFRALKERRDFIRSARRASATVIQGAENNGAANTSSAQGGIGSIISQAAGGLSFLDQYNSFSTQIGQAQSKMAKFQSQANTYAGAANLFATAASLGASAGAAPKAGATAPQGPPIS
jgi:hypothetical protein